MLILFVTAILVSCGGKPSNQVFSSDSGREAVVLLHGLGRSPRAMAYLQHRLERTGYETFSIGYPSTRLPAEEILWLLKDKIHACCASRKNVHFVGHSLGGSDGVSAALRTPGKQCGLAATGDYQPSLRSSWLPEPIWFSAFVETATVVKGFYAVQEASW